MLPELVDDLGINHSVFLPLLDPVLGSLGFSVLDLELLALLGGEVDTIVVGIPLGEGSGVDLDDTVLDEGVGPDKFVIGGIVDDVEDSGFARDSFGGPVEVALLESECSELEVASSDSDSSDPAGVRDEFGVGDGSGLFEGSLLFVDGHPAPGKSSLVPGISVDTHCLWLI